MISLALAASLFLSPAAGAAAETTPPTAETVPMPATPTEAAPPEAQAPAETPPVEATPAEAAQAPMPSGAPADDYQFVAWCYGALAGYLDLHDKVMPEVTRIETTWRRPGSRLADDLKVYDVQQRQGRVDLKRFQAALTAAEKASLQPLNVAGGAAIQRGRQVWAVGPETPKARIAQEWMSWTLPARCPATATALEARANLFGASLQANAKPETPGAAPDAVTK